MPNNEFTTLACMCLFACTWWYQLPDTTFRLSRSVETVQLYEYRPLSFPTWHVWTILSDKHCAFAMRVFCSSFFFLSSSLSLQWTLPNSAAVFLRPSTIFAQLHRLRPHRRLQTQQQHRSLKLSVIARLPASFSHTSKRLCLKCRLFRTTRKKKTNKH